MRRAPGQTMDKNGFRRNAMRVSLGVAACSVLALIGCQPYVYKPDVAGPHGEHYAELYCPPSRPESCRELANKSCKGGFESAPASSPDYLLVRCKPYVVSTEVTGPHGEHLIELECPSTTKACLDFARQTCKGDYDIFTTAPMLIECQSGQPPPGVPPGAPPPGAPPPAVPPPGVPGAR